MLLGRIVSSNQKSTPCHGQSELNGIVVSEHKFFVELTQAWSYQMKAVLLAANTRRTQSCSGSGIYLQGEVRCECPKLSILTLAKIKDPIWDRRIYKKHIIIQNGDPNIIIDVVVWIVRNFMDWQAKAHAYDLRPDAADDELLVAEACVSGRVGWDLQSSQLVARFFLKTMHFLFHLGFEVPQPCEAQNLNRSTTVAGISHVMQNKTLPCTWRSDHDEGGGDNDNSPDGDSGSHPTTDKNKPQTRSTDHQQLQYSLSSRDPPSRKNEVARLCVMQFPSGAAAIAWAGCCAAVDSTR